MSTLLSSSVWENTTSSTKVNAKEDTIPNDALKTALTKYTKTKAKEIDPSNLVPESVDLLQSRVKSVTCGVFDLEGYIDDEEGFVPMEGLVFQFACRASTAVKKLRSQR